MVYVVLAVALPIVLVVLIGIIFFVVVVQNQQRNILHVIAKSVGGSVDVGIGAGR